jgi:general secretion pathway protein J
MQDDFSQASPRPIRNTLGTTDPAFVGQPTDIRALGAPSVEFTRGGILEFDIKSDDEDDTTDATPKPPRSDLERIGYRYSEGVLYRLTWPVLDRAPTTEPAQTELLRDIEKFEVKFINPNATSSFNQWLPVWPQLAAGGAPVSLTELPRGVKVELKLKDHDEITRLFVIGG